MFTIASFAQHRRCSLLGIDACPDLDSQCKRFQDHGWSEAWAVDMAEVYRQLLPRDECTRYIILLYRLIHHALLCSFRIERIEFLDEQELLIQLLQHYCLSCGYSDSTNQGTYGLSTTE